MNELNSCCLYCSPSGVKHCLKNGFDPNEQDESGFTPLMWLMRMHDQHTRERKRIFRLLLKYGADINIEDTMSEKALDHSKHGSNGTFYKFVAHEYQRLTRTSIGKISR